MAIATQTPTLDDCRLAVRQALTLHGLPSRADDADVDAAAMTIMMAEDAYGWSMAIAGEDQEMRMTTIARRRIAIDTAMAPLFAARGAAASWRVHPIIRHEPLTVVPELILAGGDTPSRALPPIGGAVAWITDGRKYGYQMTDHSIAWLGTDLQAIGGGLVVVGIEPCTCTHHNEWAL